MQDGVTDIQAGTKWSLEYFTGLSEAQMLNKLRL